MNEVCRIGGLSTAKEAWDLLEKTHESVVISSKDETISSEEDTSLRSKAFMTLGNPNDSLSSEFGSDKDEDEMDIQKAFNKLFVESGELAKTNKNLQKESNTLKEKTHNLELNLLEVNKNNLKV